MDDMREALEWVVAQYDEWGDVEPIHVEACRQALAAPKWVAPDEDTPGAAAVWEKLGFDDWHLIRYHERVTTEIYCIPVVVLARTGEGPPNEEETREIMERGRG